MTSENRDYANLNRAVFRRMAFLRRRRGWSADRLAAELTAIGRYTSGTVISSWEHGRVKTAPLDVTFALADLFGVSIESLIDDSCRLCKKNPPAGFTCGSCGRTA